MALSRSLVMNGDSDKMVPTKNTIDLHRRLPNSQLVIYPDAGPPQGRFRR
jgi:pimeloyl-ACP methyl ester carboxylesterase